MTDNGIMKVHEHGYVKLIETLGSDNAIVTDARTSYNKRELTGQDPQRDTKLLESLISRAHTSTLEGCVLKFQVKAPIFVYRQWHRHRTQSYNEESARYHQLAPEFYFPEPDDIGRQHHHEKQAREDVELSPKELQFRSAQVEMARQHCDAAYELYLRLLDFGWPRELARAYLPLATYSTMVVTMNLLNFWRFYTLRADSHAQKEIQAYAFAMGLLAEPSFPNAFRFLRKHWPPGSKSGMWQPIETAPTDGTSVIVYAPAVDGLPELTQIASYHPDAGWCIDEIRNPTLWCAVPG